MADSSPNSSPFAKHRFFFLFSISIFMMIIGSTPMWNPTLGFDAHSYLKMSQDLWSSQSEVLPFHWQRILPSLVVKYFVQLFYHHSKSPDVLWAYKVGFRAITYLTFFIFSLKLFHLLTKKIQDQALAASLAWMILFLYWPLTYPLNNFYQLCDIGCYLLTLLILETFIEKRYLAFIVLGLASIFTRQNLFILVLLGNCYFFFQTFPRKRLLIPLGFFLHIAAIIFLFSLSKINQTMHHLSLIPTLNELWPLKSIYKMTAPFFLVLILNYKKSLPMLKEYFPITIFSLVTVYQPYSIWTITGIVNLERIIMQGLWTFNFFAAVILGTMVRDSHSKLLRKCILFLPILLGTAHLQGQFDLTFYPLFFLPSHYRNYVMVVTTIVLLSCFAKKTKQR